MTKMVSISMYKNNKSLNNVQILMPGVFDGCAAISNIDATIAYILQGLPRTAPLPWQGKLAIARRALGEKEGTDD